MRPKLLVISGWGPYRDVQTVDFSSFGRGGLFLVTGPTGSGKTTIFDAITFALYGQVSGSIRDTSQVRSDFAAEDTKTWVEFTFSHKGEQYQVRRNPSYLRKKKRGDGYTAEREQAELLLPDGTCLNGNVTVNEKLRELLAIDIVQFRQLSMIAQGEFTKLLTARADERRDIFRSVFNLGRFDRMRQAIQRREREERSELTALRRRLLEEIQNAARADEQLKEWIHGEGVDWDAAVSYVRGRVKEQEEILSGENTEMELRTREMKEQAAALERRKQKNEKLKELSVVTDELKDLLSQTDEMEAARRRAEIGTRARRLSGEYASLLEIQSRVRKLQSDQKKEKEKEHQLENTKERLRPAYESVLSQEAREKERIQEIQILERTRQDLDALRKEEDRLYKLQEDYQRLEAQYLESRQSLEELERKYRRAAVGLAARYLEEGMPCPVCGSVTHPHKARVSEEVPDEERLKQARRKTEKLQEQWNESTREAASQEGKVKERRRKTEETLKQLSNRTGGILLTPEELDHYMKEQKKVSEAYQKRAESVRMEYDQAEKNLLSERAVAERIFRELKETEEHLAEKKAVFLKACREAGFLDEDAYRAGRMEEKHLEQELKRIENFDRKLSFLKQQQIRLKEETKDTRWEDVTGEEEKLGKLEQQIKESRKRQFELHSGIESRKNALRVIEEGLKEQERKEASYGITADVARAVSGNNRQNMIFEDYVIGGYFDRILQAANQRLARMTGTRYELSRIQKAVDARSRDSLEVQVLDHFTGKYRGVKTLSGGESFKAALSLALGMADIIQRSAGGIEIETLFIDEGFGSLDSESLDQAVDTLMALAGSDRMIGIISHVGELKDRIGRQILIEKRADGSRIRMGG